MRILLAAILLSAPGLLLAGGTPIGSTLSYQGVLKDAGTAANGTYDVRACLYDVASGGTSLVCAAELNDVVISNGLMSVGFDFGLAVFVGERRYLELGIRAGTSTGAYTAITPRQTVSPVPEALRAGWSDQAVIANTVPWTGLSDVPAGFADGVDNVGTGTVTGVTAGSGLSGGTITTTGTLSVDYTQVQARLAQACATGTALVGIAANGTPTCVATTQNFTASGGLLVNGAPGGLVTGSGSTLAVDYTRVQARLNGSCPPGESLSGIAADGTPTCVAGAGSSTAGPINVLSLFPAGADVVRFDVAVTSDGRPVIASQRYSAAGGYVETRLDICADLRCSSLAASLQLSFDAAATEASRPAVALDSGDKPIVFYRDASSHSLHVVACDDDSCTGTSNTQLLAGSGPIRYGDALDAVVTAGVGLVAYSDSMDASYELALCDDWACTATDAPVTITDWIGIASQPVPSVEIGLDSNGRPTGFAARNNDLGSMILGITVLFRCTDQICSGLTSSEISSSIVSASQPLVIASAMDDPATPTAVVNLGSTSLQFELHALNSSAGTLTSTTVPATGVYTDQSAQHDVVRGDDGLPSVFQSSTTQGRVFLARCQSADCSADGVAEFSVLAGNAAVATPVSAWKGSDGRPVVAYLNSDKLITLYHCETLSCR